MCSKRKTRIVCFLLIFLALSGCLDSKNSIELQLETGIANLADADGVLGINHVLPPDTYAAHIGVTIPCGSVPVGPVVFVRAGCPWFDLSALPSDITIYSAKLVLDVNAAPASPITVEVRNLLINPLTIDTDNASECQSVYEDACSGQLYATFTVDSSKSVVEVDLSSQALADLQNALSAGDGFGIGLRAPDADDTNLVDVSFYNTAYLVIRYR